MIWSSTSFQSSSPAYITGWIDGHLYLAHEVWITLAHQHAQDVGMGVGKCSGRDVRMRIDPERRACRHGARSDSDRRGRSRQSRRALRCARASGGRWRHAPPWLGKAPRPTMPASVWSVAPPQVGHVDRLFRPSAGVQKGQKLRPEAVGGLVATLPLWHVEPQRCGSHVLHMRSVVALKRGSAI